MYEKDSFDVASLSKRLDEILGFELKANRKIIKDNSE